MTTDAITASIPTPVIVSDRSPSRSKPGRRKPGRRIHAADVWTGFGVLGIMVFCLAPF